jgi:hypothetical protein
MDEQIEVNQGVPLPRVRRPRASKYPFETMAVGASFFVPDRLTNTMTVRASAEGRRLGKKFRTRLTFRRETIEGWIACEPDDEGAVRGVAVWRTE